MAAAGRGRGGGVGSDVVFAGEYRIQLFSRGGNVCTV